MRDECIVKLHGREVICYMLLTGVAVMDQVWKGEEDYFGIYVSSSQRQVSTDAIIYCISQ